MTFFPNSTQWLRIGPLSITYYATFIMLGAILAYFFCRNNFKKYFYPTKVVDDLFVDILIVGFIGARLWFCIFYDFEYYFLKDPTKLFAIWEGGLAIHGGVIFGLIYGYFYTKRKGLSFLKVADAILPTVLLAQALGRWGNFMNKEAHGQQVAESFFNCPLNFLKQGMYIDGKYYFPTFFFESVANLIGFIVINFLLRKTYKKRGQLAYAYLMWYGLVRFFIEFYRTDALFMGTLKIAQVISIIIFIIGLLGFCGFFQRFFKKQKPVIIFDLDGTLIDTEQGIIKTYEYLFEKYDDIKNFDKQKRLEVIGPSLYKLFPKYFPNYDVNLLVQEFVKENARIFKEVNQPMENAENILKYLKENGYLVAIFSTKRHDVIVENLKIYDLDKYIDKIVGIDDVSNEKPDPEGLYKILGTKNYYLDNAIYIGDSKTDIEAAKKAHIYSVGYYFNVYRAKDLEDACAKVYIRNLEDLKKLLEKDIYFNDLEF